MAFSTVLYLVRTKYIKQVRKTFLQVFFFFPKDQHVYKVSMALMPGKGVSSALMSEEHLICIFNILYFWSVNPFKKMIKQMDNVCLIGHKEAVFLQVKFKLNEV